MNPFGNISQPAPLSRFGTITTTDASPVGNFINLGLQTLIVAAGIYSVVNFVMAGYGFLGAGDDSKKIEGAWAKIWQTALGLAVAAGSFILAAIFGQLIFGQADFIINPKIPTL